MGIDAIKNLFMPTAKEINSNGGNLKKSFGPSLFWDAFPENPTNSATPLETTEVNNNITIKNANTNNTNTKKAKILQVDKAYILKMQSGVTGLKYLIEDNKVQKDGNVVLAINSISQLERDSKNLNGDLFSDNCLVTMRKIVGSKNENENFNILQRKYRKFKQNLSLDLAIYQDLSKKSEITDAEKKFMDNFEQRLQRFINILNE